MNDVTIFRKDEFGTVRVLEEDGRTLFCGSDVAKTLGYSNAPDALNRHCRSIVKRDTATVQGNVASMAFIPEGDVYRLITHSKLPEAEKFESWVFDEVIPSIRKTGGYIAGQEMMDDDQLLANALMVAQRKIAERNKQLEAVNAKIQADAPKVLFAETVEKAEGDILVRQLAKLMVQRGYDIGEKRLYDLLRRDGFVIKANAKDQNTPTQRSVDMALMRSIERTVSSAGKTFISSTTVITPKGQIYFLNKYAPEKPQKKRPPVQETMVLC